MIFGVDPGLSGAVVLLTDAGRLVRAHRTPLVAGDFDARAMLHLLDCGDGDLHRAGYSGRPELVRVALEVVGNVPLAGRAQGASSMFSFGAGYGLWKMAIVARGYARVDVRPQQWAELLDGLPRPPRAPLVDDAATPEERREAGRRQRAAQRQRKENAVRRALALCPDLPIRTQADWALADAFLIAEWARRRVAAATATSTPEP